MFNLDVDTDKNVCKLVYNINIVFIVHFLMMSVSKN